LPQQSKREKDLNSQMKAVLSKVERSLTLFVIETNPDTIPTYFPRIGTPFRANPGFGLCPFPYPARPAFARACTRESFRVRFLLLHALHAWHASLKNLPLLLMQLAALLNAQFLGLGASHMYAWHSRPCSPFLALHVVTLNYLPCNSMLRLRDSLLVCYPLVLPQPLAAHF
jgi:hypothetical protein